MLDSIKTKFLFWTLLKRPNIEKAYKMVPPTDSWYDTITTVHQSLAKIRKLPHETLELTSHDGLKLKGIFYPGTGNTTVIWIHGYTSHAERESAFPGLFYHSLGCNVLIPYQRAHGISQGKYLSFGALEARDLERWVALIHERVPGGSILLHGLSMGGGVVLFASDKSLPGVKGIIADAPNVSISETLQSISQRVFKTGYESVYKKLLARYEKEFSVSARNYDAIELVKGCRYPLFLTAGSNEKLEEVLEQLKQSNPQETEILILPGCNHGNGMYKQTQLYQAHLKAFLEKTTGAVYERAD